MDYQVKIGLEIHIELNTKSKMFCSCRNDPNERHPNINICPVCLGHPGTLPVINEEAVKKIIKTGLALNCQIPDYSKFDRKNYFYPDLPKGYQISQYDMPLCRDGFLEVEGKKIRIQRIHLEEDTGKIIHGKGYSLINFNRAGIPLMELVTEPDLSSAREARKFAEELRLILRYLYVSNADMEKGEMRIEVNLSLSPGKELGTKVEIKNLNSFRAVEKAIEYETERQLKLLKSGKKIIQETRGWSDEKEITVSQRKKEEAHDYRYFPEPDLPPLHLGVRNLLGEIQSEIPELPQERRERFKKEYRLSDQEVEVFVTNKELGEYFEEVVSEFGPNISQSELLDLIKLASNYLITDAQAVLKDYSITIDDSKVTPENFSEFINLIHKKEISSKIAKQVLGKMFESGGDPSHIIKEEGLSKITDVSEVERIIENVISKNKKAVEDYKKGKKSALQYIIGQVMAESKGKADPQAVDKLLKEKFLK